MDNGLLEISSARQLQDLLAKDIGSSLTVAHFWAPWCDASAQMSDVIKELAKLPECKGVQFVQIEAEELPEVSQAYAVTAIPTFVFIQDGKSIDRLDGALASELTKRVRQHAASAHFISSPSVVQATSASVSREAINERLTSLVNSSPMIIFMKGSPDSPQCGFSKQLVSLLRDHNADFKTFDILKDEQVRQGLKEYSNWPTYPQVYINGELIGGLDIVKELLETKEKLPKKKLLEENAKFETFNILDDEEVRQGLKAYSNWPTYPQVYVDGQLVGGLDIIKELKEAGELNSTLKLSDLLQTEWVNIRNNMSDVVDENCQPDGHTIIRANNDHQKTASPGVSRSVGINANLQLTSLQSTSAVRCLQSSLKENRHKAVFRKPTKVLTQRDILSSDDSEALAFAYSENKAIRGQHAIGQLHKSVVCFKVRWLGMPNKSWSNGFQIIRASQIRDHAKLHLVPGLIVNVRWKKQLWPAKIMKRVCLSIPTTTSVALALAASNSSFAVVTESENSATTSLQGHSVLQSQKPLPEADILSSCFKCCLCNLLFDGSVIADHVGDAHLNGYLPYQCAELNLRTASAKRMQMAFLSRKLLVPETPISVIHKHDQVRELLLRVIVEASLQPENVFAMFEKSPGLIRSLEQMDEAFAPGFMQQTASTPVLKKPLRSTAAGQKNGNAIVSQTRKKRVRRVSVSVGGANGTTDASLAPKKPRGRPRKQTPCSGSHAEVQLESSSLEKSGIELCIDDVVAKRKVGDVNADLTSSWKASSAIKRPRGRPRKDAASVPPGLAALQFSGDASVLKMKALPRIASVRTRETELGSENVLCSSPEF